MATYRQDLPPKGGYKDIEWQRVLRKPLSGWKVFGGLVAVHAFGGLMWYFRKQQNLVEMKENFDSRIALMPFYQAEDDRFKLKQFRAWRDYEADLMKDVPGWKVGTYKGEELYHTEQNRFDEQFRREYILFTEELSLMEKSPIGSKLYDLNI